VTRQRYGDFRITVDRHLEQNERMVPLVRYMPVAVADQHVRAVDLVPQFTGPTGSGTFVFSQSPLGGTIVTQGSTVRMTMRSGRTP